MKKEQLTGKQYVELKNFFDELTERINKEYSEAKKEFEQQKNIYKQWIDSTKEELALLERSGEEKLGKMKTSLNMLNEEVDEKKSESITELNDQQKKLEKKINELKDTSASTYSEAKKVADSLIDQLDNYQTRFNLFKIQFECTKEDTQEKLKYFKQELALKLEDFGNKINDKKECNSEKDDKFSTEMSKAWEHLVGAFKTS